MAFINLSSPHHNFLRTTPRLITELKLCPLGRIAHRTDVYEAHISPQYDEVTQVFTAMVWLTKNGQIINNPTSCQIWLKDTSNTTQFNATSVSPNADGVFIIQQSSVALATEMNFECLIQVTDSTGLTWTSCDGAITFN